MSERESVARILDSLANPPRDGSVPGKPQRYELRTIEKSVGRILESIAQPSQAPIQPYPPHITEEEKKLKDLLEAAEKIRTSKTVYSGCF